jgi:D-serine deaminase-like pyridoxal phosphate-dependent protein
MTATHPTLEMANSGYCQLEGCALRIFVTVISTAVPGPVGFDAGAKTLAAVCCIPAPDSGHGLDVEYPEARISQLSKEHGQVEVSKCNTRPQVGERVTIIPNHVCPTINLTDFAWWLPEGSVEQIN